MNWDENALAGEPSPARGALARLERALRAQYYSGRTREAYASWIRRFLGFHRSRTLPELGADEVVSFLAYLAERRRVSASTQNQARSALVFFYRHALARPLPPLEGVTAATRPRRGPGRTSGRDRRGTRRRERGTRRSNVRDSAR